MELKMSARPRKPKTDKRIIVFRLYSKTKKGRSQMINIENTKLPFDEDGETKVIAVKKYSYDELIKKAAQLDAVKNMALREELINGDVVLAICGIVKEEGR